MEDLPVFLCETNLFVLYIHTYIYKYERKKGSEVQTITDAVTKTDFNSICYCVAFDSGVKRFLGMFPTLEIVFSV